MRRLLATACNLAYIDGARGMLRSHRAFNPGVPAYCYAPADEVAELQARLGELATVLPLGRVLRGVPDTLLLRLMTARAFISELPGDVTAWVDSDAIFCAPAPELWEVPAGRVNVIRDPGYTLGEMVPSDAAGRFFTPDFPFGPGHDAFNGGVFAFRNAEWPDFPAQFEAALAEIGYPFYPVYFDQPTLNRMFLARANWLPFAFNATAVNEVGVPRDVRVLHYTNFAAKPWSPKFPRHEPAYYYWVRHGEGVGDPVRLALLWAYIQSCRPLWYARRAARKLRYLLGGLRHDKAKDNVGIFARVES